MQHIYFMKQEFLCQFLCLHLQGNINPNFLFQTTYFSNFKQIYTAGYATSLISLISAIFVFTVFR